ncbi:MAG: glycosyl hydrolase family 65 protein [Planctomycetota bacterium]
MAKSAVGRLLVCLRFVFCSFFFCCSLLPFNNRNCCAQEPAFADYCQRLEQEIQGRKHGFLAGNVTYYVGGFHASWKLVENETIGLTHPFHHDLRGRGVGLLESEISGIENTGTGNDYLGWEFYKDTRVLYGTVIIDGKEYKHPVPKSMRWRPDKMICEYEIGGVQIREEKFIAANDAAASVIRSSRPIELRFEGHSFYHRNSVSSGAKIEFHAPGNQILINEGGTAKCRPDPRGPERVGPCVYSGMTTVLGCSRDFRESIEMRRDDRGVQHYEFSVPCDGQGTVVAWAMHDDRQLASRSAWAMVHGHASRLAEKTALMNRWLNEEIPWFRCSDERMVDIYYYLWAIYLMYYIEVGQGWEQENHTQTAVNNFLGMHRYDATFQIRVGAWTQDKARFAYGNVLTWKHLTENDRYRESPNGARMLSDNKGIAWQSGAYGGETCEHVLGAWQVYQHTGDVDFLTACYEGHFAKLFEKWIPSFAMNEFDVADTLEAMARLTGHEEDIPRWQESVRRDEEHIQRMFSNRWEANGIANYFAGPSNGMIMTNGFWAMRTSLFPNEYARAMTQEWALDKEKGFYGEFFPLAMSKQAMRKFDTRVDQAFGYTPDTAYFVLDGMFRQGIDVAPELAVNHLENYNFHSEWKIPVAPEAYRRDLSLFGDQYSNFNAGKILLFLEGFAGLGVSIPDQELRIRPALPKAWDWMEVRLPLDGKWTRIRYSKDKVEVENCPLKVMKDGGRENS